MCDMDSDFISFLKNNYKKGMKVRLIEMDDPQAPPAGTVGEIQGVDDIGNILVYWANGSGLSLIPNVDKFEKIL